MIEPDDDDYPPEVDDDEDESSVGPGFTVAMKGAPNMATVQWCSTEAEAIKRTANAWHCKREDLYIYRGHDE